MKNAAQEAAQAGDPGRGHDEVGLAAMGGWGPHVLRPPDKSSLRLKRSIQLFPAKDGHLYLLRLGAGDDLVLEATTRADRALVESLAGGFVRYQDLQRCWVDSGGQASELPSVVGELAAGDVLERRPQTRVLDREQAERYDRQLIYFADLVSSGGDADQLQRRLASSRVLILGCGGFGSWVASCLSCAGIGSLVLVDDDRVELSNLNRQLLFAAAEIGSLKVEAAKSALQRNNPRLEVDVVVRRVSAEGEAQELLETFEPDLLVLAADWPPHDLPRWVNRACLRTHVPWIGAGQFPPIVRVGPLVVPGASPCHECLETLIRREHPMYDDVAEWRGLSPTPDASVGPITAIAGALLANEAMHHLLAESEPASVGKSITLDMATLQVDHQLIERQLHCPACGDPARSSHARVPSIGCA